MATSLAMPTGAAIPPLNITDKSVCLGLQFGCLGNNRKVSTSLVEAETDKTMLHVSKSLLDSKELAAVKSHDGHLMTWLKTIALPSPFFRSGVYLVPIPAIEMVQERLTKAEEKRKELVEAFLAVYEVRKAEAQERLKDLADPADYPSLAAVRNSFYFSWQYVSFSVPGKLKSISAEFFHQEQLKAQKQWQEATEEVTSVLRSSLKDLVDHMVDVLQPGDDGKARRFHGTTVTKLHDYLATFDMRNVADDKELAAIVNSAKMLLNGVDAESIRKNEAVRDGVAQSFGLVKQCLDALVTEAPSRKIVLED